MYLTYEQNLKLLQAARAYELNELAERQAARIRELEAENDKLRKAGEAMYEAIEELDHRGKYGEELRNWKTVKAK